MKPWKLIEDTFSPDGPIAGNLENYELRAGQKEMAEAVYQGFAQSCISVIEAGTGTGKTLAYLIPALFFSIASNQPVVISTRTINLQEQIVYKDIPLVKKSLPEQFTAVLVKGWGNYLCLRRLRQLEVSPEFFTADELKCFTKLQAWAKTTSTGDVTDVDFHLEQGMWDKVRADYSVCIGRRCPWYDDCFFFLSREKVKKADLLITNHALLFSYIAGLRRNPNGSSLILPRFEHLILDEAHHLEDVASDFLGEEASSSDYFKILDALFKPREGKETGLLARLRNQDLPPSIQKRVRSLLDSYCIPRVQQLREMGGDFFYRISHLPGFKFSSDCVRLKAGFFEKAGIKSDVLTNFIKSLNEYKKKLATLQEEGAGQLEDAGIEITGVIIRLEKFRDALVRIWNAEEEGLIYSLEYNRRPSKVFVRFKSYPLSVSDVLYEEVFNRMQTTVLTSATLSVGRNFSYLKKRLGLDRFDDDFLITRIIDSPFDFEKQALLAVPGDIPLALEDSFLPIIIPHLFKLITIMEGRTFILFTSYKMLRECAKLLRERMKDQSFNLLVQGESSRSRLLEKFKDEDHSVLLGTDSFWEGVDVPGRDLECVVIMKLPFMVPTDPITQARAEYIKKSGRNPFYEYHLPHAVIRFKQGFGRLIRNSRDRGIIVSLDRRLLERRYGKTFFESLPKCRVLKGSFAGINRYVEKWQEQFNLKNDKG